MVEFVETRLVELVETSWLSLSKPVELIGTSESGAWSGLDKLDQRLVELYVETGWLSLSKPALRVAWSGLDKLDQRLVELVETC